MHIKKYSMSLIIMKMKIGTTARYFYILIRTTKIKSEDNTKYHQGYEETESLTYSW